RSTPITGLSGRLSSRSIEPPSFSTSFTASASSARAAPARITTAASAQRERRMCFLLGTGSECVITRLIVPHLRQATQQILRGRRARPSFAGRNLSRVAPAEVQFGERAEIDPSVPQEAVPPLRHAFRIERVAAPRQPRVPAEQLAGRRQD